MALIVLSGIAAAAALFGAGAYYFSALRGFQENVPIQFRDELTARGSIDVMVWTRSMPPKVRRDYMLSQVLGAIAVGFAAVAIGSTGSPTHWALVGVAAIFLGAGALRSYLRYRSLGD